MESDGENLDNIFEDYEAAENDNAADNTESAQTENAKEKIPVPKRIVKNPRLKFNPERLCGERGIPVLVDHFKDVKFKGPGYEREDLDKLMSRLEHWTHRLFPSMKFEDCLNQIEKLGKKRPVQTCLRKIRMDMPILSKDFVQGDEDDDVQRNDDPEPEEIVDPFDRLVQESQDVIMTDTTVTENVFSSNSFYSSPALNESVGHILGSSNESSLSEEQKQRMERNRMLAAERRKARLTALKQNSSESQSQSLNEDSLQNNLNSENTFDSLFKKSENSQTANYSNSNIVDSEDNTHKSTLKKDGENSEKLGLEDLIDLVDDEPVLEKKSTRSQGVDEEHSENLGLEDLIDLVDDEDPVIEKEVTFSDGVNKSQVLSVEGQSIVKKDSNITDDIYESPVLIIDEESVVEKESTLSDDVNRSHVLFIDDKDLTVEKE